MKREEGKQVQLGNIKAAKVCRAPHPVPCAGVALNRRPLHAQMVAEVIRTCLGPRAMLKVRLLPFPAPRAAR